MYFWKFWRDTRRGVFIYLGLLLAIAVLWLAGLYRANRVHHIQGDPASLWMMIVGITFAFSYMCALIMGFVIGNNNVGSDIGKGTGDFLLTRPRSRSYFVWCGWIAGAVELACLTFITAFVTVSISVFVTGAVWRELQSPFHFTMGEKGQSGVVDVALMLATVVLTAAVVYGLTFFMSVLLRSGHRGVVWSIAILFGYSILSAVLKQFAGISLPSINLANPDPHEPSAWYLAPGVQIIGWSLLSIAFPFAAQVSLDRADI
jgi:ABC-type transport system involved in multi-copper enzyme maturation permease subunit